MGFTLRKVATLGSLALALGWPVQGAAQSPGKPTEVAVAPVPAAAPASSGDIDNLEARVRALEVEVAETQTLVAEASGRPLKTPAALPDRFKRPALLQAVRLAFRQVSPGAEVVDVDCAEYPCIAYGSGLSAVQLRALKATPALAGYVADDLNTFAWEDTVAIIPTPKNDPNLGGDAQERILLRFHRVATASKDREATAVTSPSP
jgi:hypothetical protein